MSAVRLRMVAARKRTVARCGQRRFKVDTPERFISSANWSTPLFDQRSIGSGLQNKFAVSGFFWTCLMKRETKIGSLFE